jgi:hypothetical protein
MGMHTLDDLMLKWQHEKLTAEQMIGQMVQHIGALYEKQLELERDHRHFTQELQALVACLDGTPNVPAKANRMKGGKGRG